MILYVGRAARRLDADREGACCDWLEPGLAAGTLVVVGYGLAERMLPGLLHYAHSVSAEGRLEQPLTYWNAMGELAALGFVLCARLAGDRGRRPALRAAAMAASVPLALGLYVSFSRGALFAGLAGLGRAAGHRAAPRAARGDLGHRSAPESWPRCAELPSAQ